tara:strand:- start:77 stop:454 length:378 start_codon:yes stop_codon:yes gene_type:complete
MNKHGIITRETMLKKAMVKALGKEGKLIDACKYHTWTVLRMVQDGDLTITEQKLIDVLYNIEPAQTARLFKTASLTAEPLEVLINYKLYKANQIHHAALAEPEFALNYYSHALAPDTRFQCEAKL